MRTPSVYNIPAGQPFADSVAAGVLTRYARDPLDLSAVTILVPTRRAILMLRDAFLRATDGQPLLLPTLRAVGDVEEADLGFSSWMLEDPGLLDIPPAISPMARKLTLARLVRHFTMPDGAKPDPAEAVKLATALSHLLDAIQSEDLALTDLKDLVDDQYAAHWDVILEFLALIITQWPAILAEQGLQDPITRRNALMRAQAAIWQAHPPSEPVIAAGVVASTAATADLLHVVARLPEGLIVVPGYDAAVSDDDWHQVSLGTGEAAAHPQAGMARLFRVLGIRREEVDPWVEAAATPRAGLWTEALRPAMSTPAWVQLKNTPLPPEATQGLTTVTADTPREEAMVIALAIRQALEIPRQTIMVVTPDRGLSDRVRGELTRWDIRVDDSAGKPLGTTPPGMLMRLVVAAVAADGAPVPLLACLKHPLVHLGWAPKRFRDTLRHLERSVLRGPRMQGGLVGLRDHVTALPETTVSEATTDDRLEMITRFMEIVAPLQQALRADEVTVPELLRAHMSVCEAFCATHDMEGASEMWAKEAGHVAADLMAEVLSAASVFGEIPGASYPAVFETLLQGSVVRPKYGWHPRVQVLGLMEARGAAADVVILAGLNEGTWPPEPTADPWMSRPMRADFGLPPFERRVGQAAHDFVQLASLPNVLLTRSSKVAGAPTVPSRWLLRLEAVLAASGLSLETTHADHLLTWARQGDRRLAPVTLSPPAPTPPVASRPKHFSVTEVGKLMQDPYAIYAKRILKLSALEDLDAPVGAADRGNFIHEALEKFVSEFDTIPPQQRVARLLDIGQDALGADWDRDTVWAFWWPRFERAAVQFVAEETQRRTVATPILMEQKAQYEMPGGAVLNAKPDRIDRRADGSTNIIDYKTGALPKKKDVAAGLAPQLPLQGVMARRGAFGQDVPQLVRDLVYVPVTGRAGGEDTSKPLEEAKKLIDEAEAGLVALLRLFDEVTTPYLSHPDPDRGSADRDYAHLARSQEWQTGGEQDG